jgi:ubiquinone/menaquinone biosynthesis C-methylase UbiE
MTDRIEREKEFHNHRFAENTRKSLDKYYSISTNTRKLFLDLMNTGLNGKKVLEYGCGTGSFSFDLAEKDAIVYGIDISEVAIDEAKKTAASKVFKDNLNFSVMNAENLKYENDFFDRICGNSILHHLELKTSLKELTRVIKKGGNAVFIEPLGHNPFINMYRKLTPKLRSDDEHPLKSEDLKLFREYFSKVNISYFHLTTLLAVPFRNTTLFNGIFSILSKIDSALFSFEIFKKNAWMIVLELSEPKKDNGL